MILEYQWDGSGSHDVRVDCVGFFSAAQPMLADLTFLLTPAVNIEVVCVDEFEKPVVDAEVVLSRDPVRSGRQPAISGSSGGNIDSVYRAKSGGNGRARLKVVPGRYYLAAFSKGRIPNVDGVTSVLQANQSSEQTIAFSSLWIAGVTASGSGRFVSHAFETVGARGVGRLTTAGRVLYAEAQEKHPGAILGTATWTGEEAVKATTFTAFHSTLGWVRRELRFHPSSDFVPEKLDAPDGPSLSSFVQLDFSGPAGAQIEFVGCSLRGGREYGTILGASGMEAVPEDVRGRLFSVVPFKSGVPIEVPPGTHILSCQDGVIAEAVGRRVGLIDVKPGQTLRKEVTLPFAFEPAGIRILAPSGEDVVARVSIVMDGKTLSSHTLGVLGKDQGVVVRPAVPRNLPIEILVEPLGFGKTVKACVVPSGEATLTISVGK
jgi:hypothetical protein